MSNSNLSSFQPVDPQPRLRSGPQSVALSKLQNADRRKGGRYLASLALLLAACLAVADAQPPGRSRGRFPGFGRRGPLSGGMFIVALPEVQRELGIRPEQEKLLEALFTDFMEHRRDAFRRFARPSDEGPREESDEFDGADRRRRLEVFNRRNEQLFVTIFEPDQVKRLEELRLQFEGVRSLRRPEIVQALELNEEQRQRIEVALEDLAPRRRPSANDADREAEQAVLATLTDTQRQRWQELQGEPFGFPTLAERRRSRGPGGRDDRGSRGRDER